MCCEQDLRKYPKKISDAHAHFDLSFYLTNILDEYSINGQQVSYLIV